MKGNCEKPGACPRLRPQFTSPIQPPLSPRSRGSYSLGIERDCGEGVTVALKGRVVIELANEHVDACRMLLARVAVDTPNVFRVVGVRLLERANIHVIPFGPLVVLSELGLKLGPLGRELGEMLFEVQTVTLVNLDLCLDLLYLDLHGIDHTRDARGGAVEHLERMRGNVPLQLLPGFELAAILRENKPSAATRSSAVRHSTQKGARMRARGSLPERTSRVQKRTSPDSAVRSEASSRACSPARADRVGET
eukprot:CAMPEP_0182535172 /NCGR_PEP_ID=MMETSP1323-20130603/17218_1 /TAXON_ID=236787 /ORGANISM="Florenciella parvula, Strain RCC1693" /LENGTH=250 /DNA_ID=CAMNT_0024745267 /DNA_START=93 /DNA_END=846 /DNA_ORIENTATION=-